MDTPEEYASQSKLLQEFTNVPSIDSALILKTKNGIDSLFTLLKIIHNYHILLSGIHIKMAFILNYKQLNLLLQKTDPQQCSPLARQTYWLTATENTFCILILQELVPTLWISSGLLSPLR